jgi:hypothetical protein
MLRIARKAGERILRTTDRRGKSIQAADLSAAQEERAFFTFRPPPYPP